MDFIIKSDNNPEDYLKNHQIFLDNYEVGYAESNWGEPGEEYLLVFDEKILELSSNYLIKDFFKYDIHALLVKINPKPYQNLNWINHEGSSFWFNGDFTCKVHILPEFLKWDKVIDILFFAKKLQEKICGSNNDSILEKESFLEVGFYLDIEINKNDSIINEYKRVLNLINTESERIFKEVHIRNNHGVLVNVFSFPPEIQNACEQYLIYFSKFLEDLNISATSTIDSQARKTFFTVKPDNSEEALSKINEILQLYLSLPEVSNLETLTHGYSDISIQQLKANIYHLKSQLVMANSIIQLKDATIEHLKLSGFQTSYLANKPEPNEEEVLDGLVTINKLDVKGLSINLPEIFRRLKRKFK